MTITVNYQKRKNLNLFNKFQSNQNIKIYDAQNYIPIYNRFFSLGLTNFNSVNLNNLWSIYDIKDSKNSDENIPYYICKLRNILDEDNIHVTQKVFLKMAPLLDPYKYFVGKYNHNDTKLFNLPSFVNSVKCHPKVNDPNNSAYIDSFFSFLTSQTLNQHKFIHGLDFYGSFIGLKKDFKVNIIDDLDYLIHSDFFRNSKGKLFEVEDYSYLLDNQEVEPLKPLKISSAKSNISFNDINEINDPINSNTNTSVSLTDIKELGLELQDVTNSELFGFGQCLQETIKSGSSCSSRTSHTNDDDTISTSEDNEYSSFTDTNNNQSDNDNDNDNVSEYETDDESDCEETLYATIPKFPVQVICLEYCENTFDSLILNNQLNEEQWFSALFQIIMILITYQKMFSFTHNDLHTNNIMYISTTQKFIYYKYKKEYYKVPTYGKIFKIIDFGRAIYKFKGKIFCSDSFQPGNDAATQYNTEPYFNDKKPRLEPNFSFDLCRLACSIFDYIVNDFDSIKNLQNCSPIVKLIVDWCIDDNGINVLYKNNGVERYPDFKLYKMIARCVHKHTPQAQLDRPEFKKYLINGKNCQKEVILDIDEYPIYV